jgi:four helix bundle protein
MGNWLINLIIIGATMEAAKNFKDLIVWRKAHELVLNIYKITKEFPREELYGITSQLRRSAISIPANIAEGFKKRGVKDKARFFNIAEGSLEETKYYLLLVYDLEYADTSGFDKLTDEIGKLLTTYSKAVLKGVS